MGRFAAEAQSCDRCSAWKEKFFARHQLRIEYCGAVGKQANCQVCVEIAVSDSEIAAPAAGKLYLPERWCQDKVRLKQSGVPETVRFKTKPQIALELLGQIIDDGVEEELPL